MKTKILFLFLITFLVGCVSDNMDINIDTDAPNQVLMLKVDYTSNTFEGGTIFGFSKPTDNFTIINEYIEPSDFGNVKLIYKELNETLFAGTIHWLGLGKMTFPEKLEPANSFEHVKTYDLRYPNGFEVVFNPDNRELDYGKAWQSVQGLVKVREFLAANPDQKAKLFLYTPSVGAGNPKDWYWVIYLKK
ncbi:MAG: hypothetical protein VB079_06590 [Petrimonas sp.]|nr:hypothetical protein [Bacteroidales bacterium]MEA4996146.1 hypothetical protein [Petrimonas sp.]